MHLTTKQRQIMSCVISGNERCDGILTNWLGVSELVRHLPYKTTRDSLQFSIRALEKKGLIYRGVAELRDGRWHTPVVPTEQGLALIPTLKPLENVSVTIGDDDICFEGF